MSIIRNIKTLTGKLPLKAQTKAFEPIGWRNKKILKHQDDHSIKKVVLSGHTIWYRRPYELMYTYKEIFQKGMYRFQSEEAQPIIFDCGSNIGLSVLYFKTLFPNSKVFAFEPDTENYNLLEKNVHLNNFKGVNLFKAAVWIEDTYVNFSATSSESSHITDDHGQEENKVKAIRLSTQLNSHAKIDFLKLDIEGAEYVVLKDCRHLLSRIQNIFFEYHGKDGDATKIVEILSILAESGFSIYIEDSARNMKQPFINKGANTLYDVQLNLYCYRKEQ